MKYTQTPVSFMVGVLSLPLFFFLPSWSVYGTHHPSSLVMRMGMCVAAWPPAPPPLLVPPPPSPALQSESEARFTPDCGPPGLPCPPRVWKFKALSAIMSWLRMYYIYRVQSKTLKRDLWLFRIMDFLNYNWQHRQEGLWCMFVYVVSDGSVWPSSSKFTCLVSRLA